MNGVLIVAEVEPADTPFGRTWSGVAYAPLADGGVAFRHETHGHASASDAARFAHAGTAALLRAYAAQHPIVTED